MCITVNMTYTITMDRTQILSPIMASGIFRTHFPSLTPWKVNRDEGELAIWKKSCLPRLFVLYQSFFCHSLKILFIGFVIVQVLCFQTTLTINKLGLNLAKLSKAGTELSYLVGCWNYWQQILLQSLKIHF